MLPKASFAEGDTPNGHTAEERQDEGGASENGNEGQQPDGPFKFLSDNFSLLTNFVKGKAPQVWEKMKPYVDSVKNWGEGYYNNASEFSGKAGALGVAATIGLSALVVKVGWEILKPIGRPIVKRIARLLSDEDNKQAGYYNSNSAYSTGRGQTTTYTYSTNGYQTPYSYMA